MTGFFLPRKVVRMATMSTRELRLEDFDKKVVTDGALDVWHFNYVERSLRALKFFVIFLVLAVGAVFIPILHFVLVPVFSIAAVGSAAIYFFQVEEVATAKGVCPYCGRVTGLRHATIDAEFRGSCEHCLQLIMASPAGGLRSGPPAGS